MKEFIGSNSCATVDSRLTPNRNSISSEINLHESAKACITNILGPVKGSSSDSHVTIVCSPSSYSKNSLTFPQFQKAILLVILYYTKATMTKSCHFSIDEIRFLRLLSSIYEGTNNGGTLKVDH